MTTLAVREIRPANAFRKRFVSVGYCFAAVFWFVSASSAWCQLSRTARVRQEAYEAAKAEEARKRALEEAVLQQEVTRAERMRREALRAEDGNALQALAQAMAVEALRLTADSRYQVPWHQTPADLKQFFFVTYKAAAANAAEVWNSALARNTGKDLNFVPKEPVVVGDGPSATGTGFFITENGFLMTNAHVVKNGTKFQLVTAAGLVNARVVRVDAANDIALLKAEGRFTALAVTTSRGVRLGSTVATVGFPNVGLQGFAPKLAKGEIAAMSGGQDDPRYFQISVPVQPGNSGGALVDERGNVVGIVSAKLSAKAAFATSGALPENVNYAVKSSFLLGFLESVPEVSANLIEPSTKDARFEDVVNSAAEAAVLVLVY